MVLSTQPLSVRFYLSSTVFILLSVMRLCMSLQSYIKDSFSKHFKKMRNSLRASIKINMPKCRMGINSSRPTKHNKWCVNKFLKIGESSHLKIRISHTKTRIIVKFCTLFERLMREQFVSFSDNYYDKKFK